MSVIGSHLLNGSGTILRNAGTRDGAFVPENYQPIATGHAMRRPWPASHNEMLLGERLEVKVTHVTYVHPTTNIKKLDRIVLEGETYEVVAVLPPSLAHHIKVMLEKRQRG